MRVEGTQLLPGGASTDWKEFSLFSRFQAPWFWQEGSRQGERGPECPPTPSPVPP